METIDERLHHMEFMDVIINPCDNLSETVLVVMPLEVYALEPLPETFLKALIQEYW